MSPGGLLFPLRTGEKVLVLISRKSILNNVLLLRHIQNPIPRSPPMKTNRIRCIVALTAALTGQCLALTPITENFDSPTLDTARWYQYRSGVGQLSQQNGKLNYTTPSSSSAEHTFATIELQSSYPGYNESWEMIIDLANTSNLGKEAGCGFMICNPADRRDYLFVEFYGKSGIAGGAYVNSKKVDAKLVKGLAGVTKGSIRVRFNKTTKLLTFSASLKSAEQGYEWVKIGTFSPTGSGGNVNAKWKMKNSTGQFGIQLLGFGAPAKIPAGKITHDNFTLTAAK